MPLLAAPKPRRDKLEVRASLSRVDAPAAALLVQAAAARGLVLARASSVPRRARPRVVELASPPAVALGALEAREAAGLAPCPAPVGPVRPPPTGLSVEELVDVETVVAAGRAAAAVSVPLQASRAPRASQEAGERVACVGDKGRRERARPCADLA